MKKHLIPLILLLSLLALSCNETRNSVHAVKITIPETVNLTTEDIPFHALKGDAQKGLLEIHILEFTEGALIYTYRGDTLQQSEGKGKLKVLCIYSQKGKIHSSEEKTFSGEAKVVLLDSLTQYLSGRYRFIH